jgi:hypothetical protein
MVSEEIVLYSKDSLLEDTVPHDVKAQCEQEELSTIGMSLEEWSA